MLIHQWKILFTAGAAICILLVPPAARPATEDFSGPVAGTVIAGDEPGGGTAPGTYFPGFTVSVNSGGGGPNSAILFDSSAPTGADFDLGTPNVSCGGPGIGSGGAAGSPGENCTALGNLLIIAENIVDAAPADGIVDDPDDEALGGTLSFDFPDAVLPSEIIIVDIDGESADVSLYSGPSLVATIPALDLGNNSVQRIDLSGHGSVTRIEVFLSSSGAVAELSYDSPPTAVERESWGGVKQLFR